MEQVLTPRLERRLKVTGSTREVAPRASVSWKHENPTEAAKSEFANWQNAILSNEQDFRENVYENDNLGEMDLREHRRRIYALLSKGENVVMMLFLATEEDEDFDPTEYVQLADRKMGDLIRALNQWHSDPETQEDIPKSFIQGMNDIRKGNVVEMDVALNNEPGQPNL